MTELENYVPPWKKLLTQEEVCKILQTSPMTLRRLAKKGLLKPVTILKAKKWALKDVELYIENQRMTSDVIIEVCKSFTPIYDNKKVKLKSERI